MDAKTLKSLKQALVDLEQERRAVDTAISTIQGLLRAAPGVAHGKKPAIARAAPAVAKGKSRRKPKWSSAMRKAAKDRMKRYWEQRRKGS